MLVRKHGFRVSVVPAEHDAYVAVPPATARYRLIRRLKRRAQHVRAEQAYLIQRGSQSVDEELADAIALIGDLTGVRLDPCHAETREASTPLTLAL